MHTIKGRKRIDKYWTDEHYQFLQWQAVHLNQHEGGIGFIQPC